MGEEMKDNAACLHEDQIAKMYNTAAMDEWN